MLSTTQLSIRIAAVQGAYGHRLATYSTQVSPWALEAILGHDPRSRLWKKLDPELEVIYRQLQRTTTPRRLNGIQQYIRKRFTRLAIVCGALPSISVAVKNHLRFEPYNESNDLAGAGTLHLDLSKSNSRIVLDGLARISAVLELVELANDDRLTEEERKSLNELLNEFTLPIVIFSSREEGKPLEMREMKQLFTDFNFRQESIKLAQAMAHDSSDLYIEAARRLGTTGVIKAHRGMETKSQSLGSKSTSLVTLANLVRFVRAAAEGDRFAEAKTNVEMLEGSRLTEQNFEEFVKTLDHFLASMAATMGDGPFSDTKHAIHLSGPGWGALGAIYHDLDAILGVKDLEGMGRKLGEIDWARGAPFWADIMREKTVRGAPVISFVGGGYESRQAIRRKAHEYLGTWDQLQAALEPDENETEAADQVAVA